MRLDEYPMVLWAKGSRDGVRLIREVNFYLLAKFGEISAPQTYYADEKIELDKSFLEGFIKRHTADDGVFYTRLDATNGLRFSLSLNQPPGLRLPEVLTVSFPRASIFSKESMFDFENLLDLFRFTIRLFEPFWGSIYDEDQARTDEFQALRLQVDDEMVPLTINWFNYFEPEMVNRMGGTDKLTSAPVFLTEQIPETNGLVLVLQQMPFDFTIKEHRKRQQVVQDYLDLDKLHEAFPA